MACSTQWACGDLLLRGARSLMSGRQTVMNNLLGIGAGHEAEAAVLDEKQTVQSARRELNKRMISDATSAMYT